MKNTDFLFGFAASYKETNKTRVEMYRAMASVKPAGSVEVPDTSSEAAESESRIERSAGEGDSRSVGRVCAAARAALGTARH